MKRIGNLFESVISIENLMLADKKARKGKKGKYGIHLHDRNREANILALHESLVNGTFRTSEYDVFKVYEPKEREVYRLPYYPDRILHHAIMNVLEPVFVKAFTADTYSCIKGKGIHAASYGVRRAISDAENTQYCLKLDIKKFYPNIDHWVLKTLLMRKFKDKRLLNLLFEIIDSAPGVPIGNYLSQYFANFYLTYFDHWIKEDLRVKYYFRYADDLVFLAGDKPTLQKWLSQVREYLKTELKLEIKGNYQVFPVAARGIDFVGYVHYHTHTRLRKGIKKRFARKMAKQPNAASAASYYGWAKHCNSINLLKKILTNEHNNKKLQRFRDKAGIQIVCREENSRAAGPEP